MSSEVEKSRRIRRYLDAMKAHHAVNGLVPVEIEEWLTCAHAVADRLDTLKEDLSEEQVMDRKFAAAMMAFADDWVQYQKLKGFIEYVREEYEGHPDVLCMGMPIEVWLEKANKVADGFDPVSEVPRPKVER